MTEGSAGVSAAVHDGDRSRGWLRAGVLAGAVVVLLVGLYARALTLPLLFVLFMVPMPAIFFYAITARLQNLAAESGASALDLLGVPILLDGNVMHLSRITLGVTEACSGIRSMMTLVALGDRKSTRLNSSHV